MGPNLPGRCCADLPPAGQKNENNTYYIGFITYLSFSVFYKETQHRDVSRETRLGKLMRLLAASRFSVEGESSYESSRSQSRKMVCGIKYLIPNKIKNKLECHQVNINLHARRNRLA